MDKRLEDMTEEEIVQALDDGDIVMAQPPEGMTANCKCGTELKYVSIDPDEDDGLGLVHPCHCRITPEEFTEIAHSAVKVE